MKAIALTALASTLVVASPLLERQGPNFPSACNSACATIMPTYNNCAGITDVNVLTSCLQTLCAPAVWNTLGGCLDCWSAQTQQSNVPYWVFFTGVCGD